VEVAGKMCCVTTKSSAILRVDDFLMDEDFHNPEMDAQLALCPFPAATTRQRCLD
jgi:hypothetical protein